MSQEAPTEGPHAAGKLPHNHEILIRSGISGAVAEENIIASCERVRVF